MRVLVLNAGSSTLKASVLDVPGRDAHIATTVEWGDDATRSEGRVGDLERLLEYLVVEGIPVGSIEAVGHRVVHGGTRFVEPVVVDDAVLAGLEEIAGLAPLHNPVAIETLRAAMAALADVPHVAVFDTAFHATLDAAAVTYPLPREWLSAHGIRRFGFHGLSVAWSVARVAELLGHPASELSIVVAHLGSGCSVTAVRVGCSVATSMGMTPLEGLMMGTRAGSVDPGILLRLLRAGVGVDELAEGLDHRSGLLSVAGTADVRELLEREEAADEAAILAVELFVRSAAAGIGAAATALPALDAVVFTGGIGENAGAIRERIVGRLGVLDLRGPLAAPGDGDDQADLVLTPSGRTPAVLRIVAREDLVIADAVARVAGD
jgi:acetate kinase